MSTVYIPQGLPASGKSTWAREVDALRFNLDETRSMLWGSTPWNKQNEFVAQSALLAGFTEAVKQGRDVIWDNTNLVPAPLKRIKSALALYDVEFKVESFIHVPIDTCIERDAARTGSAKVGEQVIRKLHKAHTGATKNGWRLTDEWMNDRFVPTPYIPIAGMPACILVDIDGTLALKSDERGPYEFGKCGLDTLNDSVAWLVGKVALERLFVLPDRRTRIILLSGRGEEFRAETELWLGDKGVDYDELHMRPAGDVRPDYVVKHELFDKHVRERFDVLVSCDDRDQVVSLWRSLGIPTWQVNYGSF